MSELEPWAVEHAPLSGLTLIEASAGTGKTHTIATLVLRLLLEADLPLSQILVVTYTRAATAELRLRVRKRLAEALDAFNSLAQPSGAVEPALLKLLERANQNAQGALQRARLSEALRSFDEAPIFTIHGFCQRILRQHAFESGMPFEAELREDQDLVIEELVCDFWAERLAHASEHFVAALEGRGLDIDHLVQLVKRARANPDVRVIPVAASALLPSAELERAYERERREVEALFREHAAQIAQLIAQPGMNQRTYGSEAMRSLVLDLLPTASGLSAYDIPDNAAHLASEGLKCNKQHRPPRHVCFDAIARWLESAAALRSALDPQLLAFQHDLLAYAGSELTRRSEQSGSLGYDDLLSRLAQALSGERGPELAAHIRRNYPAALIDEFQDTDPVQCGLFRNIYTAQLAGLQPGSLFLIGDPKQAIYAFRGADVFAYIAAASSGVDRGYTLATNYRSDPGLLRGIDAVFSRGRSPFVFSEIAYRSVSAAPGARDRLHGAGAPLQILFAARPPEAAQKSTTKARAETELPRRLAAEISGLLGSAAELDGAPIEPRQIAVLCRTNAQARRVQAALRELSIPAVLDGDASVFDSAMAEELARWLWALAEPSDAARVRAALATSGIGVSADRLLELERDEAAWDGWVGRFHALQELWHTRGFMRAFHELCSGLEVPARLLALPDGERRYTDLMHLAELLHAEALQKRRGPRALLDWYRRMRAGEAQRVGMARDDVQTRLESDAHAVTLTTIHKSKGLQFPIVYVPYAWDGTLLQQHEQRSPQFHDRADADRLTLVLATGEDADPAQLAAAEREALAEQLRLLYVALTRAQHRMSVVWGALGKYEQSALAYLLHQTQPDPSSSPLPGLAHEVANTQTIDAERPATHLPSAWTASELAGIDELRRDTAERAKTLADAQLLSDLGRLAERSDGAIGVRPLAEGPGEPYLPRNLVHEELAPRVAPEVSSLGLSVNSFTRLIANEAGADPAGLDRDEHAEHADADSGAEAGAPQQAVPMFDFPAGAAFGHLVHAIYETADFQVASADDLHACVAAALADYGAAAAGGDWRSSDAASWQQSLASAIFNTLRTPLSLEPAPSERSAAGFDPSQPSAASADQADAAPRPARARHSSHAEPELELFGGSPTRIVPLANGLQTALPWAAPERTGVPTLGCVEQARRSSELEFLFPVGRARESQPLTAESIARVLRRHARDGADRAYAERLAALRFAPFSGFMRGFIDLVFEHEGRFYIVDYKSNRLGPSPSDYRPDRLRTVMQRHHYVLQYLVYSVAVHRHLALRLPGYAYDRHFGGVYYLFIRGMSPTHAAGSGIFFDRPEPALIEHLSRVFADPESRS